MSSELKKRSETGGAIIVAAIIIALAVYFKPVFVSQSTPDTYEQEKEYSMVISRDGSPLVIEKISGRIWVMNTIKARGGELEWVELETPWGHHDKIPENK